MALSNTQHLTKTKEALAKAKATKARYPKFRAYWSKNGERGRRYTTKKGGLVGKLRTLGKVDWVWFEIEFKPKEKAKFKYDGGKNFDEFKNTSIKYTDIKQALADLSLFTAKDEISFQMKNL